MLISQNSQWSGLQSCVFAVSMMSMSCHGQISCLVRLGAGQQRERQRGRESGHRARPFAAVAASCQLLLLFPPRLSAHLHTLASKPPCDACVWDVTLEELRFAIKENVLFSRSDLNSLTDPPDVWLLCCGSDLH